MPVSPRAATPTPAAPSRRSTTASSWTSCRWRASSPAGLSPAVSSTPAPPPGRASPLPALALARACAARSTAWRRPSTRGCHRRQHATPRERRVGPCSRPSATRSAARRARRSPSSGRAGTTSRSRRVSRQPSQASRRSMQPSSPPTTRSSSLRRRRCGSSASTRSPSPRASSVSASDARRWPKRLARPRERAGSSRRRQVRASTSYWSAIVSGRSASLHREHVTGGGAMPRRSGQVQGGRRRAVRIGVGGPVGSGKTALVGAICRAMRDRLEMGVVTNDIYTTEDAQFLRRAAVLEAERIAAVETGCCPHTAIRDDIAANLRAVAELEARFPLDLVLVESGGDNLTATFSYGLVDAQIFVIDVAGGDKVPRKGGPGIVRSDLLVVNKTDLAPLVGADLEVMAADADARRGERPTLFVSVRTGEGLEDVFRWVAERAGPGAGVDSIPS